MSDTRMPSVALFTYGTQPRGGVVHALELAEALHRRGVPVVLHAIDESGTGFFRTPRCPFRLVPIERRSEDVLSFVRRRIDAYVRFMAASTERFEVYHAQDGISGNALATLVEGRRMPGFVRTVHHLDEFPQPALAALQRRSVVTAQRVLAVSLLWQQRLARAFDVEAGVVPNGVDLERFVPLSHAHRSELRAELGFAVRATASEEGPLFLAIGGIERRKNTIAALEAFALVRREHPSATFAIAGGASVFDHTPYRTAFETRACELGLVLGRDVKVLGTLPDAQIVRLLQAAHALVLPSITEGFGLVALEALACETPLIASNIAPFTEYLSHNEALLADPHDPDALAAAMLEALKPGVAEALAAHGRNVARAFSWDASAAAHEVYYRAMAGASGEPLHA